MFKSPAALALFNIVLNCFSSNIANGSVELSCRPKVVFAQEGFPYVWECMQNFICWCSLKQLHNLACWIAWREFHKQMHMIWLDLKCKNIEVVPLGNFIKALFAKLFNARIHKISVSGFGHEYKMVCALPISVLRWFKFHFCLLRKDWNIAHANAVGLHARNSMRMLYNQNVKEKTYGGWQFIPTLNCWVSLPCM